MNWTLVIIIAASLVAFWITAWVTIGIMAIRTARKMEADFEKDFNQTRQSMSRHFPRSF